jgi:hypothetical protein
MKIEYTMATSAPNMATTIIGDMAGLGGRPILRKNACILSIVESDKSPKHAYLMDSCSADTNADDTVVENNPIQL